MFDEAQADRERALAAQARPRRTSTANVARAPAGFGGTASVDIAPTNRYESAEHGPSRGEEIFGGGQKPSGILSHITVERQPGATSRVGVRVDGGARFRIKRLSEHELMLTLFDTGPANLSVRRILDASDLRTNVLRVLPRVIEDDSSRVDLIIELRESAPVQVSTDDAMLWLHVG